MMHIEPPKRSQSSTDRHSPNEFRPIRVLIADDHTLFRTALRHLLQSASDIEVVGEAKDSASVLQFVEHQTTDVILMDISMPGTDGVETTRLLKRQHPGTKILILSMFNETRHISRALQAGADAYLVKNVEAAEVIEVIQALGRGRPAPRHHAVAVDRLIHEGHDDSSELALVERELDLLRLVADGLNNREIADRLGIAESTAKNRLSALFEKLGVKDRTQAALFALTHGLTRWNT